MPKLVILAVMVAASTATFLGLRAITGEPSTPPRLEVSQGVVCEKQPNGTLNCGLAPLPVPDRRDR